MGEPTATELEILPTFRQRLADLNLSGERAENHYLLRWLRARELNLDQAEDMLRKSLKWREENDMDSILSWTPPDFVKESYPMEIVGVDNDNSPVVVLPIGRWDLKKMVQSGNQAPFIRYFDQMFELLLAATKGKVTRQGSPVTQFVFIADTNKLSMRTLASFGVVDTILDIVRRFEDNHPETLKVAIAVNATKVFTFLFSMIKPLLSQRTFGKVSIYDSNGTKWKPVLADLVPRDQLPAILGGTEITDFDIKLGFSELDLDEDDVAEDGGALKAVTVPAGKSVPVQIHVPCKGSILNWKFKTEENDICYSVSLGTETIMKKQRVDSHSRAVEGSINCDSPGFYTVTFDNSFSRLRSKTVKYIIIVKEPETN